MKKFTILAVAILSIWSCNSSKITHSWTAENASPRKYNKILVVGIHNELEIKILEQMEIHMTGDLHYLGYTASSALKEFGPLAFRKMDEEQAVTSLANSGYDAVITIVLLDKTQERTYSHPHPYNPSLLIYRDRFWTYYNYSFDRIFEPGYYTTSTSYYWESNLYDLSSKKLIYSVQTKTFDPASSELLGHEYGRLIVKDMVRKNILMKPELLSVK